jgi:site-specific DNA-cytosine methylase
LPGELKQGTAKGRVTTVKEALQALNQVPVFAAFAGVDNLGHAVCKPYGLKCKYQMRVVGGSEIDSQARSAFRRRNGFEPFYENETVTSDMLKGIYVLVSGAPCIAYSLCGMRRGLSASVGTHYTAQIDAYTEAQIPVVILEQVPGAAELLPNDTISQKTGETAQDIVERKFKEAGYDVARKVVNAADYGGTVNRERMVTVAVRGDLFAKKKYEWPEATVKHDRHKSDPETSVRQMLDAIPQKRYVLPQR